MTDSAAFDPENCIDDDDARAGENATRVICLCRVRMCVFILRELRVFDATACFVAPSN